MAYTKRRKYESAISVAKNLADAFKHASFRVAGAFVEVTEGFRRKLSRLPDIPLSKRTFAQTDLELIKILRKKLNERICGDMLETNKH